MSGVNKVILVGRLGKDPEVRNLDNGAVVANFSIATSESYKDRTTGEKKEITEWHNVVLWRGLAEIAQKYLRKGDMVFIEGKLRTRSWEKDGVTRYTTEVVADNMTMLSPKTGGASGGGSSDYGSERSGSEPMRTAATTSDTSTDDLPF
ncbi:single-stranded DNA-binding protein [Pseudochryseolinea flava]|uniref:Single-stranded DNA-binding protein n=1 Tax=Pseudochryseolinea flava TaxID=2059302 RepID=A0A364Y8J9_9BACT|nr:single-stranded DNA-binding protein [Pseudochryseolinea flava]RAW03233.1 single-stranded DNA-binding protein [Pseudochryseolinea flava]